MIDFISADHGGIRMSAVVKPWIAASYSWNCWAGTAKDIVAAIKKVGLSENVMASSTMDFASEEGFENNGDAHKLWYEAIEIYNWEVSVH